MWLCLGSCLYFQFLIFIHFVCFRSQVLTCGNEKLTATAITVALPGIVPAFFASVSFTFCNISGDELGDACVCDDEKIMGNLLISVLSPNFPLLCHFVSLPVVAIDVSVCIFSLSLVDVFHL